MSQVIQALADSLKNKQPAVVATIVESKGASPAKIGAQMVLLSDGSTVGTVGGGKLESSILEDAGRTLKSNESGLHRYQLTEQGRDAIGTLCGGEVTVFVQAYFPPPQLVIVGGGHIGRPLKVMGEAAGFEVITVDVAAGQDRVPELEQVQLTYDSAVVLITTDHISDEAALRVALKSPVRYIGMIGSLSKCRTILNHLTADGYTPADFDRIYAPIGLDLKGSHPQEIAVAILAEIITCRHSGQKLTTIKTRSIEAT
jgi:xanthine dehydrogenase accessory factor